MNMPLPLASFLGKVGQLQNYAALPLSNFGGRFGNPSVFVGMGGGAVSRERFGVGRIQIIFGPAAFPLVVFMIPSTYTSMWCYWQRRIQDAVTPFQIF